MKKYLTYGAVLLFIINILTACATIKRNHVPETVNFDFPQLNTETTVYLGEEMLIQGKKGMTKELKVKATIEGMCYTLPARSYELIGEDESKLYFTSEYVERGAICDPHEGLYVDLARPNEVCVVAASVPYCYPGQIDIVDSTIISADYLQKTLLFSGMKGNEVEFMYAERMGLQTVMSHTVHYDISKNPIIGYRGARIRVISCTNESITYEVLSNFAERQ